MKKIMFNDRYGLTCAVLDGRKTQTRRVVPQSVIDKYAMMEDPTIIDDARYEVGEVVSVAQSYCSIADELENDNNATCAAHYEKNLGKAAEYLSWMENPGFSNKMFVRADLMPHHIRITDVRVERLQDISDEDCLKEGIRKVVNENGIYVQYYVAHYACYENPREAFAHLIDKVSGKGTWKENPYVFVYDFELVENSMK